MTHFEDVKAFHEAIGQPMPDTLTPLRGREASRRYTLIGEEWDELIEAMSDVERAALRRDETPDFAAVAKEIADLLVVVYGAAVDYGIDIDAVWAVVHASNMSKVGGPVREDGKQLKPAGWQPPDVARVLGL